MSENTTPPVSTRSIIDSTLVLNAPVRENYRTFNAQFGDMNFSDSRPSFLDQIRITNQVTAAPLITVLRSEPNTQSSERSSEDALFPTLRRLFALGSSQPTAAPPASSLPNSSDSSATDSSSNPGGPMYSLIPYRPPARRAQLSSAPHTQATNSRGMTAQSREQALTHFDIAPLSGSELFSSSRFATSGFQSARRANAALHPSFRSKAVVRLDCRYCKRHLCKRGMKAILLANVRVELYSTDAVPTNVQLVNDNYSTSNCQCKIRDVACLGCGNVVGYHVTAPCHSCMSSNNNGHFYMFFDEGVVCNDRIDPKTKKCLYWGHLTFMDDSEVHEKHEIACR